jgi:2-keto-4-pentenoate hydratase/2-oxohepta-3-ene-1,7-dioic acid hydratase in catechol pathway
MKPKSALCHLEPTIEIPTAQGSCHHEIEVAVLIGQEIRAKSLAEVESAIWGCGLGLDLTLRDLQNELKGKGHPWERAKAFDSSCPLSRFRPGKVQWDDLDLALEVDQELRQKGNTGQMITPILDLISHISHVFTLSAGDVVLTGTPAGVGPLEVGARLRSRLGEWLECETLVTGGP